MQWMVDCLRKSCVHEEWRRDQHERSMSNTEHAVRERRAKRWKWLLPFVALVDALNG